MGCSSSYARPCGPCGNCGKERGGYMCSSAWGHSVMCCSNACGVRYGAKLRNGMLPPLEFDWGNDSRPLQMRIRIKQLQAQLRRRMGGARVLTCVYCGQEYVQGTAAWGESVLTDHIKVCEAHPMRQVVADNERLRAALIGLVGESDPVELVKMAMMIRDCDASEGDKAVTVNAISALLTAAKPEATNG